MAFGMMHLGVISSNHTDDFQLSLTSLYTMQDAMHHQGKTEGRGAVM